MVGKKTQGMAKILMFRLKSASARPTICTICAHRWTAMLGLNDTHAKCPKCERYTRAGNDTSRNQCNRNLNT